MKRFLAITVAIVLMAIGFAVPVISANIDIVIENSAPDSNLGELQSEFMFELIITKVDAYDYRFYLEDAVFSLYTTEQPTDGYGNPIADVTTREYEVETLYLISDTLRSNTSGIVRWISDNHDHDINVSAGTFYLFETQAPDGFFRMEEPIRFTVVPTIEYNILQGLVVESPNASFSYNYLTGIISTVVENDGIDTPLPNGRHGGGITHLIVFGVVLLGVLAGIHVVNKKS